MLAEKLRIEVFDGVYEPKEDSYFLASITNKLCGSVLEIGVGTGIVSITASFYADKVVGVDINKIAVKNARYNARLNNSNAKFYKSNMFSNVKEKFDNILFNPPYLPGERKKDISIYGGKTGNEIIDLFLKDYSNYLNKSGYAYLLASSINKLNEPPYNLKPYKEKNLFFEKLFIYKLKKS